MKLSREIVTNTLSSVTYTNINKMYAAGTHWTLEESAGVKVQMDEFFVQGLTGFRDARPGGEGHTFLHTVLGSTTECYDIYVHDNGTLKGTGIYAVKPTIQAKHEGDVRCHPARVGLRDGAAEGELAGCDQTRKAGGSGHTAGGSVRGH